MKIALIQSMVYEENEKNIENAIFQIQNCAKNGAEMVVLPEMFCCPYQTKKFPIYAQEENGENFLKLSKCAKDNNIYVVAGSMPESFEGKTYNTSYVFNKQGEKIAKHRKVQLFDVDIKGGQYFKESDTLSDGNEVTVFDTEYGKFGLLICFDIRFQELSRIARLKGANCIIVPAAFNMTTGPLHWELLFRARAVDNQIFTVGTSSARDEKGEYVSYANSIIVSPWGEVVARLSDKEDVLYYDLDFSKIDQVREQIPQNRKTNLYSINYKNEKL
ncbi:MAG: carbon-nitrogen hydrolase family protein [Clostridia bacterium]